MHTSSLRIGLIAPPWVPVPPPMYGGTEMVIDHLARGLVRAGHDVTLVTTGDSTCPVDRRSTFAEALGTTGSMVDELTHVMYAHEQVAGCDIIHDHTVLGPLWAACRAGGAPVVTTVHGEFTNTLSQLYACVASTTATIAISAHQRSCALSVPIRRVIHHGIDVDLMPLGAGDGGYLLFLGRMNACKGPHRAIEVARRARRRLVIAAKMWEPEERRYFADCVEPHLDADIRYVGQVGGDEKIRLLAGATALLNPIRWPEPFGLVMIEALAVGTPVLTFAEGAAPEIVEDGRTGFLCSDEADMAAKVDLIGSLDRRECRRSASRRFSAERFVREHVELYRDVIAAHATSSTTGDDEEIAGRLLVEEAIAGVATVATA